MPRNFTIQIDLQKHFKPNLFRKRYLTNFKLKLRNVEMKKTDKFLTDNLLLLIFLNQRQKFEKLR